MKLDRLESTEDMGSGMPVEAAAASIEAAGLGSHSDSIFSMITSVSLEMELVASLFLVGHRFLAFTCPIKSIIR